ncbi:MAG: alpha/beta fold hydrolase [Fuerstiella sp.]
MPNLIVTVTQYCTPRLQWIFHAAIMVTLIACSTNTFAQQGTSRADWKAKKYPSIPDDVERTSVTIWSDGTRMAGDIYRPKKTPVGTKLPAIVFVHGTGGVKKMPWSVKLATGFAQHGYVFLNFDYRGWGESESKLLLLGEMPEPNKAGEVTVKARAIRWQMDFADQTTDIRNAIAFISGESDVDPARIGILGTSYGGGLVTWTAANDPRLKCAAVQVPGMGSHKQLPFYEKVYALMTKQARGDAEPIPFRTGAPGGKMSSYSHMRYNIAKDASFNAIKAASDVKIPMLIIDAGQEELMDITKNGGRVAEILQANGTTVKYHVIPDMGHYGVYSHRLKDALKMEIDWFDEHLAAAQNARDRK